MKPGDEAKLRTKDQEMPLSATHECENRNVVHGFDRRRNRSTYPVPPWLVEVLLIVRGLVAHAPYRPCT
jgi:hypothetical protein